MGHPVFFLWTMPCVDSCCIGLTDSWTLLLQTAERQDLSCMYLAHHELESVLIIIIIVVVIIIIIIAAAELMGMRPS